MCILDLLSILCTIYITIPCGLLHDILQSFKEQIRRHVLIYFTRTLQFITRD